MLFNFKYSFPVRKYLVSIKTKTPCALIQEFVVRCLVNYFMMMTIKQLFVNLTDFTANKKEGKETISKVIKSGTEHIFPINKLNNHHGTFFPP